MTAIIIAGNRIVPGQAVALAFGHLQLVRQGLGGGLVEIEVQAEDEVFLGNWRFEPIADHTDPINTFGFGDPNYYASTTIVLGEMDADSVWSIFAQVHNQYTTQDPGVPYRPTFNSNSYINTLLYVIGQSAATYTGLLDITWSGPTPLQFFGYPGRDDNALLYESTAIALELFGGDYNDRIVGGILNDTLYGGNEIDTLSGGDGEDSIFGGSGNDSLRGGADNDVIETNGGVDITFGGSGDDFLIGNLDGSSSGVPTEISTFFGQSGFDIIVFEQVGGIAYGNGDADTLSASASEEDATVELYGGSGDDVLYGNGNSLLTGGSGIDVFHVKTGDTITDAEGKDELWYNGVRIASLDGTDVLLGMEVGDVGSSYLVPTYTTAYQDSPIAHLAIVLRVNGLPEDFNLTFQGVSYTAYFYVDTSAEDFLDLTYGEFGSMAWSGVFNTATADFVVSDFRLGDFGIMPGGYLGDFQPGWAESVIHNSYSVLGRLIHDGIDYRYGWGGQLTNGPARELSPEELEAERAFERIIEADEDEAFGVGSGTSGTFTGDANANSYYGGDGTDNAIGDGGDDILRLAAGNDSATGGDGSDVVLGDDGSDTIDGDGGDDILYGDSLSYRVAGADGVPVDSAQNSLGNDLLRGGLGDDLIYGGAGDDQIFGGDGSDRLFGGDGANTIAGDSGDDAIFGGSGSSNLDGGDGADSIEGGLGDDTVFGGAENDTVRGGSGDDVLDGGSGDDSMVGGGGNDTLDGGTGNDSLNGAEGFDTILGGAGQDFILGASGWDRIVGGAGNDSLEGGEGFDRYMYSAGDGSDVIYDYGSYTDDDVIEFVDIASASASYKRVNDDLVITLQDGATLTVRSHYRVSNSAVELAIFSDGVSVNLETLTVQTYLQGTDGDDVLNGVNSTTAEIAYAGGGNDRIASSGGNDTIYGEAGNDTLDGGAGSDSMFGGVGDDVYIVDNLTDLVIEALDGGNDSVISSISLTLAANVENLSLSGSSSLSGTGNALANVLTGNSGANILSGLEGADTLVGGAGNDTYDVDDLGDIVTELAGGGTDLVRATLSWTLGAEIENLTLLSTANLDGTGNTLANRLTGNTGANSLAGSDGNDTLDGGAGNDTLNGGTGNDSMIGGAGDDLFVVDAVGDVVSEASAGGTDTVQSSVTYTLATNVEALVLTGSAAINGTGNTLANIITGNGAANFLSGGSGNDTINGGAGNDTLVADAAGDVLIESADGGIDLVQSLVNWTLGADFEDLALTGTSGLTGTGNALANVITGNSGANSLSGLEGNDTLVAGAGNDTLNGGFGADSLIGEAGNDTYDVDDLGDIVTELAAGGTDLVRATLSWTLGAEIENLTLLGTANLAGTGNTLANALVGNAGANTLLGGDGNDTLDGGAGNDTLNGGTGNDSMIGGAGDDLFVVDAVGDVVSEASAGGTDTVQASVTYTLATNVEALALTGSAAINGTGNTLANIIIGNDAANLLSGGSGNDTIFGEAGSDTLDGGTGTDSLTGGAGDDSYIVDVATDVIVELTGEGIDSVSSSVTYTLSTNVEHLTLIGTSGLSGTGNAEANRITGNSGANSLSGLDGNDTLIGGGGNDSLNGGLGADQFVFTSTASGVDVIADFNELNGGGEEGDVLRFEGLGVGTFAYLGTGVFTGGSDNSEARISGSQVLVDANGDGAADITITLTGLINASQLGTDDFLFV